MSLTAEEQERLAYIQGDLAKAELLAALIDAEDAASGMAQEMADSDEDSYQAGWADGHAVGMEEGKRIGYEEGSRRG